MRWKKKGSKWRLSLEGQQVRITEDEGIYLVSWRKRSGEWFHHEECHLSLSDARKHGEEVVKVLHEAACANAELIRERRTLYESRQRKLDAMPRQEKAMRSLILAWDRASSAERVWLMQQWPAVFGPISAAFQAKEGPK